MSVDRGVRCKHLRNARLSLPRLNRPRGRRRRRALALAVLALLVWPLLMGMAPAAGTTGASWPSLSLSRLFSWLPFGGSPHWGHLPRQQTGTAAGRPHTASAASTRAGRGAGHRPGRGAGQLGTYAPLKPRVKKGMSARPPTGFSARTSKRVASKSTATSDFYRNADGSYTRTLAMGPVNYRAAPGDWQPINTSIARGADGRWREKANSLAVSFAPSAAATALVRIGLDSTHGLAYGLAGAAAVAPHVSGSTATYTGVLPATDLVLRPTAIGTKESLVLHSANAPDSWTFPLAPTGLTPAVAKDGSIDLVNASGTTMAVIPPGYAHDSNVNPASGEPATTHAVSYQLTTGPAGPALVVTLDPAWLHDPARVFPVTVDPSTLNSEGL